MGASPGRASPADRDVLRPGGFACQMRAINTRARAREGADSACRWATPASHRGFDTSRVRSARHILLKLAENAGWDPEMLRLDLGDLKFTGFDLSLTGSANSSSARCKITPSDMPPPYATESANNGPTIMEGSTYHDATVRSTGLPAWNRDPREIKTDRPAGSAGAQSAIGRKPAEERVFRPTLLHLADRIGTRLRAKSKPGRTVTVRVRFANLNSATRSVTLDAP
ncbi:MAG: hypothetical protein E6G83_15450, partial [Alphaproteobacteria bacterium]